MQLHLKKPLVIFDLEATGTNITLDKIIEFSFVKVSPTGEQQIKTSKVNPLIPIPAEVSLIHGIYDADVKDQPTFKDFAKDLNQFLSGCDLAGFNSIRYDVPLLVEEFLRAGVDFNLNNRNLIDTQKIFHLMEKRNLAAAYKFYCGETLENAHSAEADTLATYEVLKAQVERYKEQEVLDPLGNKLGVISNNMKALHDISVSKMVDLAGRMVLNDDKVEVINFGKHKGKPVERVLKEEPAYYDWIMRGDFPLDTKRKFTEIKMRSFSPFN